MIPASHTRDSSPRCTPGITAFKGSSTTDYVMAFILRNWFWRHGPSKLGSSTVSVSTGVSAHQIFTSLLYRLNFIRGLESSSELFPLASSSGSISTAKVYSWLLDRATALCQILLPVCDKIWSIFCLYRYFPYCEFHIYSVNGVNIPKNCYFSHQIYIAYIDLSCCSDSQINSSCVESIRDGNPTIYRANVPLLYHIVCNRINQDCPMFVFSICVVIL